MDGLIPDRVRPWWNRVHRFGPLLLVGVILLPALFGESLLGASWQRVDALLSRLAG